MIRLTQSLRARIWGRGSLSDFGDRYPALDRNGMSSVPGLYVTGNIAGHPDIRAALNSGTDLGRHLLGELTETSKRPNADCDVLIIGAGPAGVACGAALRHSNLSVLILERAKALMTIRSFKPDLVLYDAVTGDPGNRSPFPYQHTTAEELLALWKPILSEMQLPIREGIGIANVTKRKGLFEVELSNGEQLTAHRVVMAVGKLVHLEKLGPAEEKLDCRLIEHAMAKSDEPATSIECDVVKRSGIRMERSLDKRGLIRLFLWMVGVTAMYLWLYYGPQDKFGRQIIPFTDLALPGWFLYSTTYTAIIWIFGIRAIRRWKSPLQTRKYALLIASQTILFWILPNWVFSSIQGFSTPASGYELAYIWPLAIKPENTQAWFNGGGWVFPMFLWNLVLSFMLIPLITIKHGKKYCSWVCGCGGLAETLGDRWRHYSPKGKSNTQREHAGYWVTGFAGIATILVFSNLLMPSSKILGDTSSLLTRIYGSVVDVWLIGIIPVALYPFLGGKTWCRYWCPSAVYMQLFSRFWGRRRKAKAEVAPSVPIDSGFAIHSTKERCIACNMCSRYCEVGIDVRKFAIKGTLLDNTNSSCIGCGICISVCPTATLSFDAEFGQGELVRQ